MKEEKFLFTTSVLSIAVGFVAIIGWIFGIETLKCVVPGFPSMKINTAICFVLLGIPLFISSQKKKKTNVLSITALSFCLLISGLTLASYIFNFDNRIDELFMRDDNITYAYPGRMAHATAFCFFILALGLLLVDSKKQGIKQVAQYGFHLVTLIAVVATLGYILGIPNFYKLSFVTTVALHTSILFFFISIAAAKINPKLGITKLFIGQSTGAIMARNLYPLLCVLVVVLSILRILTHQYGIFSVEFGIAMFALSFILVGLFIVAITAKQLNGIDVRRIKAENELKILNNTLEKQVQERTHSLKRSLEELSFEQQRHQQMILEIQDYAVYRLDVFGNIESWNSGAQKIKGYTADEVIGKNFAIFYTKEDIAQGLPQALILEAMRTGNAHHVGWRIKKDKSRFWAKVSLSAIHNAEHEVIGFSKVTHDLTSEAKSAKKISDLTDRLLLAANASKIGIWEWDIHNDILLWDERMFLLYGMNRSLFSADFDGWKKCILPEDQTNFAERIEQTLQKDNEFDHVFGIMWPNGSIHYLKTTAIVKRDESGKPVHMIGTGMDVTFEKNAQNELIASNERGEKFIEAAPSAIAMFDTNLCYIAASNKWLEDYNLVGQTILGRSHYEIFPEIGEDWKTIHQKCLKGHIDRCDEAPFERSDGSIQWISWDVRPWYSVPGKIGGLIMSTADVTERKKNEELLRKFAILEAKNKEKE